MLKQLENATPVSGMNLGNLRTPNAALAQRLYASSRMPGERSGPWTHGRMTTANESLFDQTHYSEPMTNYAVGWTDEEGYDALVEFLAPSFPAPGELFEYLSFDNAEEFLSDETIDDLRAIDADFKTVDYTQQMNTGKIANRGLRVELDWDRIKNDPIWQQRWTGRILRRLKRNQARRAAALMIASATSDALTWNADSTQPDIDVANQKILSANATGIKPNRLLYGESAWQVRITAYGLSNSLSAAAGLARDINGVGALLQMQAMIDAGRFQNGGTKSQIIGSNILLFTGMAGAQPEDPTNLKLAWTNCQTGMRFGVYVRQISVKKWEIVVEHYELLFAASVLGVLVLPVSNS